MIIETYVFTLRLVQSSNLWYKTVRNAKRVWRAKRALDKILYCEVSQLMSLFSCRCIIILTKTHCQTLREEIIDRILFVLVQLLFYFYKIQMTSHRVMSNLYLDIVIRSFIRII